MEEDKKPGSEDDPAADGTGAADDPLSLSKSKDKSKTSATKSLKEPSRTNSKSVSIEKETAKEQSKQSVKDSIKESLKESIKDSPKASLKDSVKDSPVDAPKDSPKPSLKDSIKESIKELVKDSTADAPKESPKPSLKDSIKEPTKDSPKPSLKDSIKESGRESAKDINKSLNKESLKDLTAVPSREPLKAQASEEGGKEPSIKSKSSKAALDAAQIPGGISPDKSPSREADREIPPPIPKSFGTPSRAPGAPTPGVVALPCSIGLLQKRSPFIHNPPQPEERRARIQCPRTPREYIINLREDLADFQESHGLPRTRDYSFISLGLALAQETGRAICSVFLMITELFPVIAIVSLILRFALDKLIEILETTDPSSKAKKSVIFALEMLAIMIPLWILIGTIILPLASLILSIFMKTLRIKGGKKRITVKSKPKSKTDTCYSLF